MHSRKIENKNELYSMIGSTKFKFIEIVKYIYNFFWEKWENETKGSRDDDQANRKKAVGVFYTCSEWDSVGSEVIETKN